MGFLEASGAGSFPFDGSSAPAAGEDGDVAAAGSTDNVPGGGDAPDVPAAGGSGPAPAPDAVAEGPAPAPDAVAEGPAPAPDAGAEVPAPAPADDGAAAGTPPAEDPAPAPTPTESTPAPSSPADVISVLTITLDMAGTAAQRLAAVTAIAAEISRELEVSATFKSARRMLFARATPRALQAGSLCAADAAHSTTNITIQNYADEAAATRVVDRIMDGTTPLPLDDETNARDTICGRSVSLMQAATTVAPLIDSNTAESGKAGLSSDGIILIAVLVPAAVMFFVFLAIRRRRSSNSQVAQV